MAEKQSLEQEIARALRPILAAMAPGGDIAEKAEMKDILATLEYFLPPLFAEVYPHWKYESFDGFYLAEAKRTETCEARLRGICILIDDQTTTPFDVRLRISPSEDVVDWMECRVGKPGDGNGGMERTPWSRWWNRRPDCLRESLQPIDWVYKITFGAKQALG